MHNIFLKLTVVSLFVIATPNLWNEVARDVLSSCTELNLRGLGAEVSVEAEAAPVEGGVRGEKPSLACCRSSGPARGDNILFRAWKKNV